jgi:CDP-2,3-bis-(O-geranylgeranyl)-sn-glycerol synthase
MIGTFFTVLFLLVVANGTPVLTARLLGDRAAQRIDLDSKLPDGWDLFGPSKTWRGLLAALVTTGIAATLLGHTAVFGVIIAGLAMAGDLVSSFIKRRRGLASSSRSTGLDQLPEALLPTCYAVAALNLPWWWILALPAAFMVLEIYLSKPLFKLGIRKRPY